MISLGAVMVVTAIVLFAFGEWFSRRTPPRAALASGYPRESEAPSEIPARR